MVPFFQPRFAAMNPSPDPGEPGLALVTGGAHRLGKAIAFRLARMGFAIALHSFQAEDAARETTDELSGLGVPVYPLVADLRDPAQIAVLFAQVEALPHPMRVLVNSAAVIRKSHLMEISVDEWDDVMALNLRAPLLCSQAAARLMISGGVIVNISDVGARKTWTAFPAYSVSKSALETLTRLLARACGPSIRVNAIAPGLILPSADVSEPEWERLVARLPLRHAGSPDNVAQAVEFVVRNDYITGQVINVDGGYELV